MDTAPAEGPSWETDFCALKFLFDFGLKIEVLRRDV